MKKDVFHSLPFPLKVTQKLVISEKRNEDLAAKLREMTNLYERSDRDAKQRAQEIVKLANDLDRSRMENDGLKQNNGKPWTTLPGPDTNKKE